MPPTTNQTSANHPGRQFMLHALRLAHRGQGFVEPNPMVGCVVVRNGKIVAQGWHKRFGGPHAEIQALTDCRNHNIDPAGLDIYVTLEPCSHHGKTPPCADALIQARPTSVTAAMIDPNPLVAGKGIAALRHAGIAVHAGLCELQAGELNNPYIKKITRNLPWVIAKWAQTIDGKIAASNRQSKWISSPQSRRAAHQCRARVDAVIVGIGTVLADDPLLTPRHVPIRRVARRVIIDPNLRLPMDSQLIKSLDQHGTPLTVAVNQQLLAEQPDRLAQLTSKGVEFVSLPPLQPDNPQLDLKPLLEHLASLHNATNVLIEGGSRLLGSLFNQKLIDQYLVFLAPMLMADHHAGPALAGTQTIKKINELERFSLHSAKRLGDDMLLDYRTPTDQSTTSTSIKFPRT